MSASDKSPDPMSGELATPETGLVERSISGETLLGMPVAGYRWEHPIPVELQGAAFWYAYASHWSTGPKTAERLYAEGDVLNALTSKDEEIKRLKANQQSAAGDHSNLLLRLRCAISDRDYWRARTFEDPATRTESERDRVFHAAERRAETAEALALSLEAQVEGLKRALGKWSCKGCDGRGANYYEGQDHACRICDRSGLNPIARAALASLPQGKDQQP